MQPVGANMTTIGLIGSGHIGSAIARLALAGGHQVVLSNRRGPESLAPLVAELGEGARADTVLGAAAAGDIVVVTIPLRAIPDVPAEPLVGKIVIDTNNYYSGRDGVIPELEADRLTVSEWVQQHLSGSRIVKAFNNIASQHLGSLARPAGAADRSALIIAGDDVAAKEAVVAFLDSIGYDALDAGALAEGRRFQKETPAYGLPYFESATEPGPGTPADVAVLQKALAAFAQAA